MTHPVVPSPVCIAVQDASGQQVIARSESDAAISWRTSARTLRDCFATVSLAMTLLVVQSACTVGPDYRKPDVSDIVPNDWHWKPANAQDAVPKGEWWKAFGDPVLDRLEAAAVAGNPTLRGAVARVDEARATARLARSQFYPQVTLDPSAKRERTSGNLPTPIPFPVPAANLDTFSVPLDLSYEIDLWGRVRRSLESARAQAEASVSDQQNVLLTLTADVAINYFMLRTLDAEIGALRRTLVSRADSLRILEERFAAGVALGADVEQARTQVATARTDLADATRQRAETLDALAVLCGRPASGFEVEERPFTVREVTMPPLLPSELLQRRPDIARAERALVARNAQIGVARAAYFPSVQLIGQAGFLSKEASTLFSTDSGVWSIGPRISLPIFTGGRTAADVARAEAAYEEAVADYRSTVLIAFREVEDSLAQIVLRGEQSRAQDDALRSASNVLTLARARYEAGTATYLEVADAERNFLQQERRQAQLQGQRYASMVRLVKALGGGWAQ
jgi:multidrug efflux system outer membrane protein